MKRTVFFVVVCFWKGCQEKDNFRNLLLCVPLSDNLNISMVLLNVRLQANNKFSSPESWIFIFPD